MGASQRPADGTTRPDGRRRVVVVLGQLTLAQALCHVLERAGYHAQYDAEIAAAAGPRVLDSSPDVVIIGPRGGEFSSERRTLIAELAGSGIPVIGLSGARDSHTVRSLDRRAGATVVLEHDAVLARLVDAVDAVSSGAFEPEPAPELTPDALPDEQRSRGQYVARLARLSNREREILAYLSEGLTVDVIAKRDQVATSTVRGQVASVLRKLEVSTQLAAVAVASWAAEHGGPRGSRA